jgi:SPP1 family predicted phage head-tail adaptor
MIDPGKLNLRLTLEAPVETPDGAGGVARSYATVTTLWASVVPVSAHGSVEAQALGATITHRIRIRYRADVTLRHRFRYGARTFRVVAVREQHKRFLDIDAEERVD